MRSDIKEKLINYAKTNEAIDAMFYLIDENYDSFIKVYTIVNEVIIAKLEEEILDVFDDVIMLNRTKDEFTIEKNKITYTNINIYTKDNIKLTEAIITDENFNEFTKSLPKGIEFIYKKPGFDLSELDDNFKYPKPSEYEIISTIKNFFASAYEVSLYIDQKDQIAACVKMDEVREYLLSMINYYILDKYSYTKNIGSDGQGLKNTLEIDLRDNLLMTYHHEDYMDIYNSLFKACVLFRKLSMGLCEKFSYPYPREIDVETLKVLRKNYKALESFLN